MDDDRNGYIDDVHGYNFLANSGDPMDNNFHGTHLAGARAARLALCPLQSCPSRCTHVRLGRRNFCPLKQEPPHVPAVHRGRSCYCMGTAGLRDAAAAMQRAAGASAHARIAEPFVLQQELLHMPAAHSARSWHGNPRGSALQAWWARCATTTWASAESRPMSGADHISADHMHLGGNFRACATSAKPWHVPAGDQTYPGRRWLCQETTLRACPHKAQRRRSACCERDKAAALYPARTLSLSHRLPLAHLQGHGLQIPGQQGQRVHQRCGAQLTLGILYRAEATCHLQPVQMYRNYMRRAVCLQAILAYGAWLYPSCVTSTVQKQHVACSASRRFRPVCENLRAGKPIS